jgi:hypothetical protein
MRIAHPRGVALVLYFLAAVFALFLLVNAVGMLVPATWTVTRVIASDATASAVFPWIASFRYGWTRWSPWRRAERAVFAGPDIGRGAVMIWNGGRLDLVATEMDRSVVYEAAVGEVKMKGRISLHDLSRATQIRWRISGLATGLPMMRLLRRAQQQHHFGELMQAALADLVALAREQAWRDIDESEHIDTLVTRVETSLASV